MIKLRAWQSEACNKCLSYWAEGGEKQFLINAAPAAGKTIAACTIAQKLLEHGEIDRVIVLAPQSVVTDDWAKDFKMITGRSMERITGNDPSYLALETNFCSTWQALSGMADLVQAVCQNERVLVICDEIHHAALEAAWGNTASSAFADAKYALILTGTPMRSDGAGCAWLELDNRGALKIDEAACITLTYGDAVDNGYCRPITFHRHEGEFSVRLDDESTAVVTSKCRANLNGPLADIPALHRAIEFSKLVMTPQFEKDGITPMASGYQGTMFDYAQQKLDELVQNGMPNAGGLVIAPDIEMAEYMADLIENKEGERPILVHSRVQNAKSKIRTFRNGRSRWLVSVAMVSEGVDIPRLRVLIYLPNALTELFFRQAMGRVVRNCGPQDLTRAYVVMPALEKLDKFARRVEDEMPAAFKVGPGEPKQRICPSCGSKQSFSASACTECGHKFIKQGGPRNKACNSCGALNPINASTCNNCGESFSPKFTLTLKEAMRSGAIVRGLDLDEETVREGEELAPEIKNLILNSGDAKVIEMLGKIPEEMMPRVAAVLAPIFKKRGHL